MDEPRGGAPGSGPGDHGGDSEEDADLVVAVLHRVGRCSVRGLLLQPDLAGWTSVRLERAVARAWCTGLVYVDRDDDLVAL